MHHDPSTTDAQPAIAQADSPAHCRMCGRFIGPAVTCPYCGTSQNNRVAVNWIKLAAVLLAIVGLIAIWLWARLTDIPQVLIGDIGANMNLAYARVQGSIAQEISYDAESDFLSFWVTDGSGDLYVSCYEDTTTALIANGQIPEAGDRVDIAGTLRIRDDFLALTLNTVEHLSLTHLQAEPKLTNQVTVLDEGKRIYVEGIVGESRSPYPGLMLVEIEDDAGQITLTASETITQLTGALPEILPGYSISAEGTVTLYRGTPQLTLTHSDDVTVKPVDPVVTVTNAPSDRTDSDPVEEVNPLTPLQDITSADLTKTILTQGHIVLLEGINGGVKALLDNGVTQIPLVLWNDTYEALPHRTAFDIGADIEIRAQVNVYEGNVELVARSANDITILTPAPAPDWVAVGDLGDADVGRCIRIRGITGEPSGFSAGVKVPLSDGSGTITVLLWSNIYDAIPGKLNTNTFVEVTGIVQSYRGELELIPRSGYDWIRIED